MKRDVQASETRKLVEKGSYVTKDGREVLKGLDWKCRVKELAARSKGQCEFIIQDALLGFRCLREAQDPHHIVLRSVKRDDRLANLLAVCRHHHHMLDLEQRRERHKR